jgi:hypothetical protein
LLVVNIFLFCATKKTADAAREAADAAKKQAELTSKQMEGVSAAILELKSAVPDVFFTPPTGGQVRFSFNNIGHVIARDVHVKFTATIHSVANPNSERELVSGEQTVPMIPPASANASYPDLIFDFRASDTEAKSVTEMYKSFVRIEGSFSYGNGFGNVITQQFCQGYIWGPGPKIGRLFPRCIEIPGALKTLREAQKQ